MKKTNPRSNRVAEEIKKVISESLLRGEIGSYESINPTMIAITDVEVSPCLRHAKVFISPMIDSIEKQEFLDFMEFHIPQLRKNIGHAVRLKFVPELHFFIDDTYEYAQKIENLLAATRTENSVEE